MPINKNHIRFIIQLIGVLIIASLAVTGAAVPSLSNSGGGSWQYYKEITVSNSGSALSDYQVLVSLTSGDFPTNAQTSGADIRFTDVSGAELSYWIESWYYSSRTAKIWVKVPSISAGTTTTIRMYYGNPSATSVSSGEGAFVFFDDFSGGSLSSKWISSVSPEGRGTVTVSNGMLNLIANPTPGPSGTWSVGEFAQVKSTASFPLPYKLVFRYSTNLPYSWVYPPTGASGNAECYHLGGMSDYPSAAIQPATDNGGVSNGIIHMYSQNAGNPRLLTISTSTITRTNFDLLSNIFKTFEYRVDSSSVKFISDGTVIASHSTNIPITPLPIMFEASQSRSGYSRCGYYDVTIPSEYHVDYVFLTKYASSEPSVSNVGAETSTSTPTPTPTTPTPTPTQQLGTIIVTTNKPEATFTITGTATYSGSGTYWSQSNVPAGTYTITYTSLSGHISPPSETKTLRGGALIGEGSIIFSGTYTLIGTVTRETVTIGEIIKGGCQNGFIGSNVLLYNFINNKTELIPLSTEKQKHGAFVYLYNISDEGYVCVFDGATSNYYVSKAFRISLRTIDSKGTAMSAIDVYRELPPDWRNLDKKVLADILIDFGLGTARSVAFDYVGAFVGIPATIIFIIGQSETLEFVKKFENLIKKDYIFVGQTDNNGYIETWVLSDKKTVFKAEEHLQLPSTIITWPETDYSIQNVLNRYPWKGEVTIITSTPNALDVKLGRNVAVVIHAGKNIESQYVDELKNFFKNEFGIVNFYESIDDKQRLDYSQKMGIIDVTLSTGNDDGLPTSYVLPTFYKGKIIDEYGNNKYSDKSNGVVSYYHNDNPTNIINYGKKHYLPDFSLIFLTTG